MKFNIGDRVTWEYEGWEQNVPKVGIIVGITPDDAYSGKAYIIESGGNLYVPNPETMKIVPDESSSES